MITESKLDLYKKFNDKIEEWYPECPEEIVEMFNSLVEDFCMEHENLRIMIELNTYANEIMKKYMKIKK